MAYVDGVVLAVPSKNREAYRQRAAEMAKICKEYGAIKVVDCWGDDVPDGKVTSFPMAVQCGAQETVVFSWVWWPSKEVRDEGKARLMRDERLQTETGPALFDGSRVIFGGFAVIVDQ